MSSGPMKNLIITTLIFLLRWLFASIDYMIQFVAFGRSGSVAVLVDFACTVPKSMASLVSSGADGVAARNRWLSKMHFRLLLAL